MLPRAPQTRPPSRGRHWFARDLSHDRLRLWMARLSVAGLVLCGMTTIRMAVDHWPNAVPAPIAAVDSPAVQVRREHLLGKSPAHPAKAGPANHGAPPAGAGTLGANQAGSPPAELPVDGVQPANCLEVQPAGSSVVLREPRDAGTAGNPAVAEVFQPAPAPPTVVRAGRGPVFAPPEPPDVPETPVLRLFAGWPEETLQIRLSPDSTLETIFQLAADEVEDAPLNEDAPPNSASVLPVAEQPVEELPSIPGEALAEEPRELDAAGPARLVPLRSLTLERMPRGSEFPTDYAAERFESATPPYDLAFSRRGWESAAFVWEAPGLCHRPLYFEETNLERYGHQVGCGCIQPVVSAAHFFATVPALPYLMTVNPPCECIYTLGHYRPGNYVDYHCNCVPLRADAAAVQAGVVTGLIILIP